MFSCGSCCEPDGGGEVHIPSHKSSAVLGMETGNLDLPEPAKPSRPHEKGPEPAYAQSPLEMFGKDEAPNGRSVASEFIVEVEKSPELSKVGLDVDHGNERTLEVVLVKEGLIQNYNKGVPPEKQMRPGDVIVEVNGQSGSNKKILETVGREKRLKFLVRRNAS